MENMQRVDGTVAQMRQALHSLLKQGWERAHALRHGVIAGSPEARVHHGMALVPQLRSRLEQVTRYRQDQRMNAARSCLSRLHALSPLGILDRGYSIVETLPGHEVVRDAGQVVVGQEVLARLAKGRLRCAVTEILTEPSV
jgi:exodeoxyribonuclease VII large subunit